MTKLNSTKLNWAGGLLAGLTLSANLYAGGEVQVANAWARATAPGQSAASVDLSITSKQAATLTGASSPVARSVELHSMSHQDGMMKMREVDTIELPPGKPVELGASGYHLMLSGLKTVLKPGDRIPLTLDIKLANKPQIQVLIQVEVKPLNATR